MKLIGKFPDPLYADFPINVISLYDTLTNNVLVWIYNKDVNTKFTSEDEKIITKELKEKYDKNINQIIYCCFEKEHLLLENFLTYWEHNYPDIITGWNINKFDILYIVKRIIKILGEGNQYRLSPIINTKKPVYTTFENELNSIIYKIQRNFYL